MISEVLMIEIKAFLSISRMISAPDGLSPAQVIRGDDLFFFV
jgi:hypothetical protein